MSNVPDYPLEETIDFKFTTRSFSTGVPTTLGGTPAIEVYEDNSLTQITAGETLTVDFDSITGLNNLRIAATAANGYESGKSYAAVISTGTVGGVSVVGEVVAQFSIERSPALRPTTAGRTLDVTAGGTAGIDWANVESQNSVVDLSATDIQLCDTVTTNTDMRGTDSAALASVCTEVRLAELDAANLPADIDAILLDTGTTIPGTITTMQGNVTDILADTNELQGDWTNTGRLDTILDSILEDTGTTIPGTITTMQGNVTDILADTNELQGDWTDSGRLDLILDAILVDTNSLNDTKIPDTISLAAINAEVDTALATTTYAEPALGAPAATASLKDKLGYLYKAWRNKSDQDATTYQLYNDDASTVDHQATVSDDGSTATKGEVASG